MRAIFILIAWCLLGQVDCVAQCNYYFFQNNKTITMGFFNKKGNQEGKLVYKTSDAVKKGSRTSVTLLSEVFDKKNKTIASSSGTAECDNGMLLVDMKMMMSPQQTSQFESVEATGKGMYLEYPSGLSVGQELKDGNFDMDMKLSTGIPASVTMDITNRKVVGKENITTPAGTWDAFKITYNAKTVISMGISIPVRMEMTEWFVPGFGLIRSESKQGKTELLSIE